MTTLVYKLGAVKYAIGQESYAKAADVLEIPYSTLCHWIDLYGDAVTQCEHNDMARLADSIYKSSNAKTAKDVKKKYDFPEKLLGCTIQEKLTYLFNKTGMTRKDFTKLTGITSPTIRQILEGKKIRNKTILNLSKNLPYSYEDWTNAYIDESKLPVKDEQHIVKFDNDKIREASAKENTPEVTLKPEYVKEVNQSDRESIQDTLLHHKQMLSEHNILVTSQHEFKLRAEATIQRLQEQLDKQMDLIINLMQQFSQTQNYKNYNRNYNNNYHRKDYNNNYQNNSAIDQAFRDALKHKQDLK